MRFEYAFDVDEIAAMIGRKFTLYAQLRAGANFSPTSGTITAKLYCGVSAPARRGPGAFGTETTPLSVSNNITTSATQYTFAAASAVPVGTTQISLVFEWTPVGTAGANDYFEIDDVMLLDSSVVAPTAPTFYKEPWATDLLKCSRFYQMSYAYGTVVPTAAASNSIIFTTAATVTNSSFYNAVVFFTCEMRAVPTITVYSFTGATAGKVSGGNGVDLAAGSGGAVAGTKGWQPFNNAGASVSPSAASINFHYAADARI